LVKERKDDPLFVGKKEVGEEEKKRVPAPCKGRITNSYRKKGESRDGAFTTRVTIEKGVDGRARNLAGSFPSPGEEKKFSLRRGEEGLFLRKGKKKMSRREREKREIPPQRRNDESPSVKGGSDGPSEGGRGGFPSGEVSPPK